MQHFTVELMEEASAIANRCGHNLLAAVALDQMKRTETMGDCKPAGLIGYLAVRPLATWVEPLRHWRAAGVKTPQLDKHYRHLVVIVQCNANL